VFVATILLVTHADHAPTIDVVARMDIVVLPQIIATPDVKMELALAPMANTYQETNQKLLVILRKHVHKISVAAPGATAAQQLNFVESVEHQVYSVLLLSKHIMPSNKI